MRALSQRQIEVLRLIGAGHTTKAIALELQCSYHTIREHKRRAFDKLGVSSNGAAVDRAHRLGLLGNGNAPVALLSD